MRSPLDIDKMAVRYHLDEPLKAELVAFDTFIWQDCIIESVEQLVAFEIDYQQLGKNLGFCYDNEIGEMSCVEMENGTMDMLCKGRFAQFSQSDENDPVQKAFLEAGLTELETLLVRTLLADISALYRLDAYSCTVPPFVRSICDTLNNAISKLPEYNEDVVRRCVPEDRSDFVVGDAFSFGYCLTTSADLNWKCYSNNRYRIHPLQQNSKARAIFQVYQHGDESQVNFLQDAQFRVVEINPWGDEGYKEFVMEEI